MLVCLRRLCVLHLCFCTVQRQQPQGTGWENMVCSFMRLRRSIFKESGEKRIERGYKVGNKVILKHKTYYLIQRKSNWRKLGAGESTPIDGSVPNGPPWKLHTHNIILTEKVIFRNTYAYTYMYSITISENRIITLKQRGICICEDSVGGKGETSQVIISSKIIIKAYSFIVQQRINFHIVAVKYLMKTIEAMKNLLLLISTTHHGRNIMVAEVWGSWSDLSSFREQVGMNACAQLESFVLFSQ